MSIELHPSGVFGKRTPRDDFSVLRADGHLPADSTASAGAWVQAALSVQNRAVTALHRVDSGWWLLRADRETATDSAGRQMAFAVFGRLSAEVAPRVVPNLLLKFSHGAIEKDELPLVPTGAPVNPQHSADAAGAAVTAVLGQQSVIAVGELEELAAVLDRVGLDTFDWVAFAPDRCPTRLPAGTGLLLTGDSAAPPASEFARGLVEQTLPATVFKLPLNDLIGAANGPEGRAELLRVALGQARAREGSLLVPMAAWLIDAGVDRATVLTGLMPDAVGSWLSDRRAEADDVNALRHRLRPAHRAIARALLERRDDALTYYARAFPDDTAGMLDLLPADRRRTWQRLESGEPVEAADANRLFDTVADGPLSRTLTLGQLATAAASESRAGKRALAERLTASGLPTALAHGLVYGEPPAAAPTGEPAIEPEEEWLRGIAGSAWSRVGHRLASSPVWAAWWRRGTNWFVANDRLPPTELLKLAIESRDPELARRGGAPQALTELVNRTGGRVEFPPQIWQGEWNDLLDALARDDALVERIAEPGDDDRLREALDWLEHNGSEAVLRAIRELRRAAFGTEPARPATLQRAVRLMSRAAVLRQIVSWAARPHGPERCAALGALFSRSQLDARPHERGWLDARTRWCAPLPSMPEWTAAELVVLFPLLDPIDIVRRVLNRPVSESAESSLLPLVVRAIVENRCAPPGAFPEVAWTVHHEWTSALVRLPGWEWCGSDEARLGLIREACRRIPREHLSDPDRRAVDILARGGD